MIGCDVDSRDLFGYVSHYPAQTQTQTRSEEKNISDMMRLCLEWDSGAHLEAIPEAQTTLMWLETRMKRD